MKGRPRPFARAAAEFLNAANGLRPLTRHPYASVLVFWLGWPTSEVPELYLTASAVDAVRRGRRGDFAGPRGKAALALTAASWAILGVIRYRGVTTPAPVLETGLREQLGPDYADELAALPTEPSRSTRKGRRNLPARSYVSRRQYVDKENVVRYGPHGRANLADIWRRRDLPKDGKAPVLLQVPGGAWMIGWRRPQAYPMMSHLVSRGWVCVSMNYRVSPLHTWPDHIVDVKRALAWVKENIAAYGGDPNFVAISGGSAGGHLSALAALTPNDPKWQPGFEEADTSVVAAVPIYGRYDWYSTDAPGRVEFLEILARLVVKKKFSTHRHIYRRCLPGPVRAGRRTTVFRSARNRRLTHPGRGSAGVRRRTARGLEVSGLLRRTAQRTARFRYLRLTASESIRRGDSPVLVLGVRDELPGRRLAA